MKYCEFWKDMRLISQSWQNQTGQLPSKNRYAPLKNKSKDRWEELLMDKANGTR